MTDFLSALFGAPARNANPEWPKDDKAGMPRQSWVPPAAEPEEPTPESGAREQQARHSTDAFITAVMGTGRRARPAIRPALPLMDGEETQLVTPFGPRAPVDSPDERVARATGVSRSYLRSLAGKESSGDNDAEAGSSSAVGRAQFIESTWFDMLERYGARYGLDADTLANTDRADLLELRRDAEWSEVMAAEFAIENEATMRRRLNRPITEGEVYLGHFLGVDKAVTLLRARPNAIASQIVGDAAFRANMPVFYTPEARFRQVRDENGRIRFEHLGGGRLRTAAEVIQAQTANFSRDEFRLGERGMRQPAAPIIADYDTRTRPFR